MEATQLWAGGNAGSAPVPMETDEDEWVHDVYARLNGTPERNAVTCWQSANIYRALLILLSGCTVACGTLLVFLHPTCLPDLPSFNIHCTPISLAVLMAGLLISAVGFMGLLASYYTRCIAASICAVLVFFTLSLLLAAASVFLVLTKAEQTVHLGVGWANLVRRKPELICDVQERLQCSGYAPGQCCRPGNAGVAAIALFQADACYLIDENGTTYDPDTRSVVLWPRSMCTMTCEQTNRAYTQDCESRITSLMLDHFIALAIILSTAAVLFGACGALVVASSFYKPRIDHRMRHRF